MSELQVITRVHRFLEKETLWGHKTARLYTDPHPTLVKTSKLKPFQRFTLDMTDFVMHPDLAGQLADGETTYAIEGKGSSDIIKGMAQAEFYQNGFHCSFLAAEASKITPSIVSHAQKRNVGVFSVDSSVKLIHLPYPAMPLKHQHQFITRQFNSVALIAQTFHYNLPTHYLVWVIALTFGRKHPVSQAGNLVRGYPLPRDIWPCLGGARKLGIVRIEGSEFFLTRMGEAIKAMLPNSIKEWAAVHQTIKPISGPTLAMHNPVAAAALRLLLLKDPVIQLITEALQAFPGGKANFLQLAIKCNQLDTARAQVFFLNPEKIDSIMDNKGRITWSKISSENFRSRSFYQYKSILKHAGLLAPNSLGGASTKSYNGEKDFWILLRP